MFKKFIGIGKWSPSYLYILGASIFKCLRDCLFNFNSINPESKIGLFGFTPILSNHTILTSIYMYISYILLGLLFYYISNKKLMKENNKKNSEKLSLLPKGLIHNKKNKITIKRIFQILSISFIIVFHSDIIKMLYLLGFSSFDIWTFDIIFILFFMNRYFVINIYKHHKYSMLFIIIGSTILILISTFFPKDKEKKNSYQIVEKITGSNFSFLLIFLIFISISYITAFGRVLSKVLMDVKFISPYVIIISTGIMGLFLNSIALIFTSIFKCSNNKFFNNNSCLVKSDSDYYYDNLLIYFSNLKTRLNGKEAQNYERKFNSITEFYVEILAITPIYLLFSYLEFSCEIFTINYLSPNFLLIRDNLYYGLSRIVLIIYNSRNNNTILQFVLLELAEIIAILGYLVYLEIIELKFFGLDENLKKNLILKAEAESSKVLMEDMEDDNSDDEDKSN